MRAPETTDPLHSPLWAMHAERLFGDSAVTFDDRVRLNCPMIAENQHVFPILADARGLGAVRRMIVLVDLDPFPVPIDFAPLRAAPWIGLRIKLDQRTPVRIAALDDLGVWHVAGQWVDAAGGGCSAPPVSRARGDWAQHLGELRGRLWREPGGTRLRCAVRHPMDTGLVDGIPAYNLETVRVSSGANDYARITVSGSVSEDPAFSLLLPADAPTPITIAMRDSNGLEFHGVLR